MLRYAFVVFLFALLFSEVCAAPIPSSARTAAEEEVKVSDEMLLEGEERRDGGQEVYYAPLDTQSGPYDSTVQGAADEDRIETEEDQEVHYAPLDTQSGPYDSTVQGAADEDRAETEEDQEVHYAPLDTQSGPYDSAVQGAADEDRAETEEDQKAYHYDDKQMDGDDVEDRGWIQDTVSFLVQWLWIGGVVFVVAICIGICMCYRLINRYGDNLPMKQIMSKYQGYEGAMKGLV